MTTPEQRIDAIRCNLESYEEWCCTCCSAFDASDSSDCPECGRQQPWLPSS